MTEYERQLAEYYIFVTANLHGLKPDDLKGPDRHQHIVDARFDAMDKIYTSANFKITYREIGEFFGNRTPATVANALNKAVVNKYFEANK